MKEGWSKVTLQEVCLPVDKVKRKNMSPDDELIYLDIGGIDNEKNRIVDYKTYTWESAPSRAQQIIDLNDVLFSTVRTYLRNIAQVQNPLFIGQIASSGFTVLRANPEALDHRFLFLYTLSEKFLSPLHKLQSGSSYPAVRDKDVLGQLILLPPVQEQRAIAAKLDGLFSELDKGVKALKNAQEKLKLYRQSLLLKHLVGRGRVEGNNIEAPVRIGRPKDNLPGPMGWSWVSLNSIARLESGHTPRKSVKEYWDGGDVPWISLQDIRAAHGSVIFKTKYCPTIAGIENSSARILPAGTVVFSRDISVGFVTIMGVDMATTQHFANWVCSDDLVNTYLMYCLMASRLSLVSRGVGTTVKTIYMDDLNQFQILLPSRTEQLSIVQRIEHDFLACEKIEEELGIALAKAEKLKQGILKKAFSGDLLNLSELQTCAQHNEWSSGSKHAHNLNKINF